MEGMQGMQGEFIEADDPRWTEFIEEVPHDIYHQPAYGVLTAQGSVSAPIAWLGESEGSRLLIPLLETRIPVELSEGRRWSDLASPYGYASPLLDGDPGCLPAMLRSFSQSCLERGCVTAFLRSHPLLAPGWPDDPGWNSERSSAHLVSRGQTVYIDLSESPAVHRSQLRTDHRRGIDRLLKRGYTSVVDDWSLYGKFVEIYRQTMSRVHASDTYFFPDIYFRSMRELLAGSVHLISILDPKGHLAASGLFFLHRDIIQYHLGGSDPDQMKMSPFKLSIHAAMEWGRERGARYLHLGGGLGAKEDALFWFKSGFSSLRRSYSTLGILADREAYAKLVQRSGADPAGSFFPAYRAQQMPLLDASASAPA